MINYSTYNTVCRKERKSRENFQKFFYCLKFPLRIIPDDYSFFCLSPLILIIILRNINFLIYQPTLKEKEGRKYFQNFFHLCVISIVFLHELKKN